MGCCFNKYKRKFKNLRIYEQNHSSSKKLLIMDITLEDNIVKLDPNFSSIKDESSVILFQDSIMHILFDPDKGIVTRDQKIEKAMQEMLQNLEAEKQYDSLVVNPPKASIETQEKIYSLLIKGIYYTDLHNEFKFFKNIYLNWRDIAGETNTIINAEIKKLTELVSEEI